MPTSFHTVSLGSGIQDSSLKCRWTECSRTAKGERAIEEEEEKPFQKAELQQPGGSKHGRLLAQVWEEQGGAVKQTWMVREAAVARRLSAPRNGSVVSGPRDDSLLTREIDASHLNTADNVAS